MSREMSVQTTKSVNANIPSSSWSSRGRPHTAEKVMGWSTDLFWFFHLGNDQSKVNQCRSNGFRTVDRKIKLKRSEEFGDSKFKPVIPHSAKGLKWEIGFKRHTIQLYPHRNIWTKTRSRLIILAVIPHVNHYSNVYTGWFRAICSNIE
jgi:hypothetical protein